MADDQTSIAQRSSAKIYFDHQDMDYYLMWILGREPYGGSRADECMAVVSRIPNGDAVRWGTEWRAFAEQVRAEAEGALATGDIARARGAFLRACTYFRAPLFIMRPNDPVFADDHARMKECFRSAAALFDPPIEPITVPYQNHQLEGYLWKGDAGTEKQPTVIVFGGIETFAEDCYFMTGPEAPRRGYTTLTVDLPGQGMTPKEGLHFGAQMEYPVHAAVDYALTRPEVDGERLAIFGFSWGGHIVFKGAQYDTRVKAMIANPPMPNVFRAVLAQQQGHDRNDPLSRIVFDQIVWRMGLRVSVNPRDIANRFRKAYDYFFNGKADPRKILCPVLCLAGEGEAPITLKIARECLEQLPNPKKKLVIFTRAENGEAHCQINNLPLPNQVMFDWLHDVWA